ncbi:MAG: hypothetical protein WDM92_08380 [Caulobacteraceae bacterium]
MENVEGKVAFITGGGERHRPGRRQGLRRRGHEGRHGRRAPGQHRQRARRVRAEASSCSPSTR